MGIRSRRELEVRQKKRRLPPIHCMVAWPLICFGISHTGFFRLYSLISHGEKIVELSTQLLCKVLRKNEALLSHISGYISSQKLLVQKRLEIGWRLRGKRKVEAGISLIA